MEVERNPPTSLKSPFPFRYLPLLCYLMLYFFSPCFPFFSSFSSYSPARLDPRDPETVVLGTLCDVRFLCWPNKIWKQMENFSSGVGSDGVNHRISELMPTESHNFSGFSIWQIHKQYFSDVKETCGIKFKKSENHGLLKGLPLILH